MIMKRTHHGVYLSHAERNSSQRRLNVKSARASSSRSSSLYFSNVLYTTNFILGLCVYVSQDHSSRSSDSSQLSARANLPLDPTTGSSHPARAYLSNDPASRSSQPATQAGLPLEPTSRSTQCSVRAAICAP